MPDSADSFSSLPETAPQGRSCAESMRRIMHRVQPLPEDCWEDISSLLRLREYRRGESFAEVGDFPRDMAFICSGVFRSFYRTEDGVEYNKTFFTEDTFMVALTAMIRGEKNLINIEALCDSRVLLLDYHRFTELFDRHQVLERLTRKVIELEWAKKEIREIRLVLNNATERYRFFLEEHPGLENRIPQYHIASYLGITPIQLSRIRAKLAAGDER
ncbi:MAG TPA: Crp/Fnr family transcriptional regulator [Calditrichia bacterium]|nr:Crp/Fnr family transcriptional regulator [Calditrichia bacterium]